MRDFVIAGEVAYFAFKTLVSIFVVIHTYIYFKQRKSSIRLYEQAEVSGKPVSFTLHLLDNLFGYLLLTPNNTLTP